jgi:hypothetical protein
MEAVVVIGNYEIAGGTGRFAHATGEGTFTGRFNSAGQLVLVSEGVISY